MTNIFMGLRAGSGPNQNPAADNSIAIGEDSYTTASNQAVLGNPNITHTALSGSVGIGLGLTPPSGVLHAAASTAAAAPLFSRQATTDMVFTALRVRAAKVGDMGAGFGPLIGFYVRDDAGVDNVVGAVGASRLGADNTGEVHIRANVAGTLADGLKVRGSQAHLGWNSAIPAGGAAGTGYTFSTTSNFGLFFGSGAPALSAAKGSLYLRSDAVGANDRTYVNTNGATNWEALLSQTTNRYFVMRQFSNYADTPMGVNSTSYLPNMNVLIVHIDLDMFPATHFRIVLRGSSSEAGQTVSLQLDAGTTGAAPAHSGGNDIAITNTTGIFDSGWRARDDGETGFQLYNILCKGSNASVDLLLRFLEVHWKIQ